MRTSSRGFVRKLLTSAVIVFPVFALFDVASAAKPTDDAPIPLTVPKAVCGPNDHPETGLQGQVPAALRATGFKGFNCNLELISQVKGDGANWQTAEFRHGHARV